MFLRLRARWRSLRRAPALALAAGVAVTLTATTGAGASDSPPRWTSVLAAPAIPYSIDSPFVRDRYGRAVFFHGVNAVWKLPPYYPPSSVHGEQPARSYFDERDARFLANNGLNSVRIGVLFAGVEPSKDNFDAGYLDKIDQLVDALARHDVTVMLDFHQDMYNERFAGEGFPDWSVYDDGIPATNCCGFPGNYFTPAVRRAFDNLWDNRNAIWDDYRDAWAYVARWFEDQPNLLGYDLLNEPWPGSRAESCANPEGCPEFDTQKLQPFFEHVMAGVRKVDPDGIIWWDANVITNSGAKNNVGLQQPITPNRNQGISFHVYCIAGSPTTGVRPRDDPSCPQSEPIAFANQVEAAARNNSGLFLTEFGASDDRKDIRRVTRLADEHMVSWHYWHYADWKDPTTTGTGGAQGLWRDDLDRPGSLKQRKANVLIRTYPQAVAGAPRLFRFYPARHGKPFKLVFAADPAIDRPTVIFVPVKRHYAGAYRVEVDGPARVTSRRNARRLLLQNTGAGQVTVKLRRAVVGVALDQRGL